MLAVGAAGASGGNMPGYRLTIEQRVRRNEILREFRESMTRGPRRRNPWSVKLSELLSLFGIGVDSRALENYAADRAGQSDQIESQSEMIQP